MTSTADPPLSAEPVELVVAAAEANQRLDTFLAIHFKDYSRVHLRRVISAGGAKVDGRGGKPAYRLKRGQRVAVVLPEIPRQSPRPENIPLDVLYEDEQWWSSTSRRAWSCIRREGIGRARWPARAIPFRPNFERRGGRAGRASSTGSTATPAA